MSQINTKSIEFYQDIQLLSLFDEGSNDYNLAKNNLETLKSKQIALIGVGGIGSICTQSLIRSGISNLTIIDGDIVEKSNLGRQSFYQEDISHPKVTALEKQLKLIQHSCTIKSYFTFLTQDSIDSLLENIDIVIDCSDNLKTRRIINSYCLKTNKLWIHSGAQGFECITCIFDYSKYSMKNLEEDMFSKLITPTHEEQANCSSGVLISSTTIAAQFIITELLLYMITQKTTQEKNCFECIKLNLLNSTIFKLKL